MVLGCIIWSGLDFYFDLWNLNWLLEVVARSSLLRNFLDLLFFLHKSIFQNLGFLVVDLDMLRVRASVLAL